MKLATQMEGRERKEKGEGQRKKKASKGGKQNTTKRKLPAVCFGSYSSQNSFQSIKGKGEKEKKKYI